MAKIGLVSNMSCQLSNQLTRSLEKILEEAHLSGELNLSARNLKDFPKTGKYDLSDTVTADLTKNRFQELPEELTSFWYLERLVCYHNVIRSVPESVVFLQSLVYIDLNRNLLSTLPAALCQCPLQILLVSNNRLTTLPDEIGRCRTLREMDVSCNQLTHLPHQLGQLSQLRFLNVRNNLLLELPIEVTYLKLTKLTMSENRIATLPVELRLMDSLVDLELAHNPLVSPPASICVRGRVHIFKYLELRSAKENKVRYGGGWRGGAEERRVSRKMGELRSRQRERRFNSDVSTPSTLSPGDSSNYNSDETLNELGKTRLERSSSEREVSRQGSNTPESGITSLYGSSLYSRYSKSGQSVNGLCSSPSPSPTVEQTIVTNGIDMEARPANHMQSYKEYKDALRQQRSQDNIYKNRRSSEEHTPSPTYNNNHIHEVDSPSKNHHDQSPGPDKRPVQKVLPSRNVNYSPLLPTDNMSPAAVNGFTPAYVKPAAPQLVTASVGYVGAATPPVPRPLAWNRNVPPDKLSFTMRREFEKAKEEAELIQQLRTNIETRLKMSLPADLAPALSDGVVLCHLANHVRPRSVASIHVPSPAVPKLTTPRCRRNVDNFLEACRKIGVEENLVCCAVDVLEGRGLVQVAITVAELLRFHHPRSPAHLPHPPPPQPS